MRQILFYQVVYHVPLFIFLRAGIQTRSLIGSFTTILIVANQNQPALALLKFFFKNEILSDFLSV